MTQQEIAELAEKIRALKMGRIFVDGHDAAKKQQQANDRRDGYNDALEEAARLVSQHAPAGDSSEVERLKAEKKTLNDELYRVRTTQQGDSVELEKVRFELGVARDPEQQPSVLVRRMKQAAHVRDALSPAPAPEPAAGPERARLAIAAMDAWVGQEDRADAYDRAPDDDDSYAALTGAGYRFLNAALAYRAHVGVGATTAVSSEPATRPAEGM